MDNRADHLASRPVVRFFYSPIVTAVVILPFIKTLPEVTQFQISWLGKLQMRNFLALKLALIPLVQICWIGAIQAADSKLVRRPNIIFIMADDLGYGELGCYGQTKIRTPRIDQLAAEGIRFTQHYSGCPVCAPSRCVLMTGLHTGHSYIRNNREIKPEGQEPIPPETVTVAELLKEIGYTCGAMGKWGLGGPGSQGHPNLQGFDLFFGYLGQRHAHNHYPRYLWRNDKKIILAGNDRGLTGKQFSHDLMTQEALGFIRENQQQPFFLYVPYAVPHLAIQVPEDSLAEYRGLWPDPPYEGGHGYLPHPAPRAGYAAMVTRMDRDVGRIVDLVAELGLSEDTLIMFSSDNGPTYDRLGGSDSEFFESAGPLRGLKGSVHEGGLRIPLVARWKGHIPAQKTSDHISAFWDFLPTVVEIAGGIPPSGLDGISFVPTLLGQVDEQEKHDFLYWEFRAYGGQQTVRMGDWKVVRTGMNKGNMRLELYNLSQDIGESNNIADAHPEIIRRAEQVMREQHVNSAKFPFPAID